MWVESSGHFGFYIYIYLFIFNQFLNSLCYRMCITVWQLCALVSSGPVVGWLSYAIKFPRDRAIIDQLPILPLSPGPRHLLIYTAQVNWRLLTVFVSPSFLLLPSLSLYFLPTNSFKDLVDPLGHQTVEKSCWLLQEEASEIGLKQKHHVL